MKKIINVSQDRLLNVIDCCYPNLTVWGFSMHGSNISGISDKTPAVVLERVSRSFRIAGIQRVALDDVSLTLHQGEVVGLIGPSGSGKSTLLRHIAGLTLADNPESRISVLGRDVQSAGRRAAGINAVRREIGFIFQQFNLVDRLPVLTNVLIGRLGQISRLRRWTGWFTTDEMRDAMAALDRVGISDQAGQRAGTLSGGQQQRAAIARALMQRARVILADEPIASLDPESSRRVMETLCDINRRDGVPVVVSLHQVDFARRFCHRIVALTAGRVVFDGPPARLDSDLLTNIYGAEAEDAGIVADRATEFEPSSIPLAVGDAR